MSRSLYLKLAYIEEMQKVRGYLALSPKKKKKKIEDIDRLCPAQMIFKLKKIKSKRKLTLQKYRHDIVSFG